MRPMGTVRMRNGATGRANWHHQLVALRIRPLRYAALVVATSTVLLACGTDSPGGEEAPATTIATQTTDLAVPCETVVDQPRFGGEAGLAGAARSNGRLECGLEFHADAVALSELGLVVNPACPHEASIIVWFTATESGEMVLDEVGTSHVDNGGCL
jgi:hypothetical protein